MSEERQFEALLDALYSAAIDPQKWPIAQFAFVEYLGVGVGHMNLHDWKSGGEVVKAIFKGIDPATIQLMAHPHWVGRDSLSNAILRDPVSVSRIRAGGAVFQGAESIPPREYIKTDFFQEIGRRSEAVDHLTVTCSYSGRFSIGMGAHTGHADGFTRSHKQKATKVLPHLKRAFGLYMRNFEGGTLLTGKALWECFSVPVLVFSAGKLVFKNQAGEHVLARSGLFRNAPGASPSLVDANAQSALDGFLSVIPDASAPWSHVRICTCINHKRWLLQLVRIKSPSDTLAALFKLERQLALATFTPLDEGASRGAMISTFTQLTPGEREILERIANGQSPTDIAEQTQRSVETVRWYIKSLTGKLEARGFADLARMAGMILPVKTGTDTSEIS